MPNAMITRPQRHTCQQLFVEFTVHCLCSVRYENWLTPQSVVLSPVVLDLGPEMVSHA